jgi:two-component system repressor protein LuxO
MSRPQRHRILLVEDCPDRAWIYQRFLGDEPVTVEHVSTSAAAMNRLTEAPPAAVVLDLDLPDMDGRRILDHIRTAELQCDVLVITAQRRIDLAVEAMRAGASGYLVKPFKAERLVLALRSMLEHQLMSKLDNGFDSAASCKRFHGFIGVSPIMQAVYRMVRAAAPSKATVFITGESGTGKEVCAQAIHACGPRRGKRFVAIDCAAIPRELMESEIFGHAKGAFTGAIAKRVGAARLADGGTLFLDEICEMDPALQTKLLRFIQTGVVRPVGGDEAARVDVRLVCATNKDPIAEVEAGRFREDLYYRLHVIPLHLPPLREREEDILPIARHFLARIAGEEDKRFQAFAPEVERVLCAYDWPGNVRQLQNLIHNVVALNDGELVVPAMLPPPLDRVNSNGLNGPSGAVGAGKRRTAIRPLWQIEKEAIEAAIAECDGCIAKAAELLEISPSTIYRKRTAWEQDSRT